MENFSVRDEIIEAVNKLFIYTDSREWSKLQNEVFSETVLFDMSSAGGNKAGLQPKLFVKDGKMVLKALIKSIILQGITWLQLKIIRPLFLLMPLLRITKPPQQKERQDNLLVPMK